MNKIVRKHYPAAKLPAELRGDIPEDSLVEVIVEEEPPKKTMAEKLAMLRDLPKYDTTEEEAVARVRALRDEWDD